MKVNFDIHLSNLGGINFNNNSKNIDFKNKNFKYENLNNRYSYPVNYYLLNNVAFRGRGNGNIFDFLDSNIAGYKKEKEKIADLFINPVIKEKETRKEQNVPAGILLYAQDTQDGDDFIYATAKTIDAKVKQLDTDNDNFERKIYLELKEARQRYIDTNQRTIVVVKNSDKLISASRTDELNARIMKTWLEDCAKLPNDDISIASAATFVFETENPSLISPAILNHENFAGVISLPLRNKENIEALLKSENKKSGNFSSNLILSDKEAEILSKKLASNDSGAYSTSRIKTIMSKAATDWEYESGTYAKAISNRIDKTRRDISPRTVKKSKENVKWLIQNGFTEKPELDYFDDFIEEIIINCASQPIKKETAGTLTNYQKDLNQSINNLSTTDEFSYESLSTIEINGTPLPDYWLTLEGKNPDDYTQRIKEDEINKILSDKDKTSDLISKTLDELQKTNSMIESARRAYQDIIENEDELTPEQKDILIKQQDSKLFFEIVTDDLDADDKIALELNTIRTIRQLSKERENIKQNAVNNIFNPARSIDFEDEETGEIASYIFNFLSQKAENSNEEEKDKLRTLVQNFEEAKDIGDTDKFNSIWQEMVDAAQQYFEKDVLDNLTDRNIYLLNSINQNIKGEKNAKILSLIKNSNLTIEQKEFVSRYKKDSNFKRLVANPNVDIEKTIEELVYFEAANIDLIENNELDVSYKKVMSDKFHEIDSNAKDVNIQGNKISDKLDTINNTIKEQNGLISSFANIFANYANESLNLQYNQLQQLVSINQNTAEIRAYTQAITRTKLAELEKDKYYKDIVPQITALLPDDEQINIKDFLAKVDELAKHEKNDKLKKKIIKAGLIIAGTVAAGALIYYAGPAVVAHLASQLPSQMAIKSATATAAKVGLAKSIGNSGVMAFGQKGNVPNTTLATINELRRIPGTNATNAKNAIEKIIKDNKTISIEQTKEIIRDYHLENVIKSVKA